MHRRQFVAGLGALAGATAHPALPPALASIAPARRDLAQFAAESYASLSPPTPDEIEEAAAIVARLCATLDSTRSPVRVAVEAAVRSDLAEQRWSRIGDIHVTATDRALQILATDPHMRA